MQSYVSDNVHLMDLNNLNQILKTLQQNYGVIIKNSDETHSLKPGSGPSGTSVNMSLCLIAAEIWVEDWTSSTGGTQKFSSSSSGV